MFCCPGPMGRDGGVGPRMNTALWILQGLLAFALSWKLAAIAAVLLALSLGLALPFNGSALALNALLASGDRYL